MVNTIQFINDINGSTRPSEVPASRRLLPQILASIVKNIVAVSFGLFETFPTLVIPSLTGISSELNPDEDLSISAGQASWLASVSIIGTPVGCLLSGFVSDKIGRRRAMMLVNIPFTMSWLLLAYSNSVSMIAIAFLLSGLGIGLMEAPVCTYVSEICEPSIRGTLLTISPIFGGFGALVVLFLGSFLSWRQTAFICAFYPIITIVAVFFIPEAPMWLLSKNKSEEALKSLQYLRGWVPSLNVQSEFDQLQQFYQISNSCADCQKIKQKCCHKKSRSWDKMKEIKRKRNLKPFVLCILLEFFVEFTGTTLMHSYFIQIFKSYAVPVNANVTAVYMSISNFLATIGLIVIIKFIGKRKIYLGSAIATALTCFALGIYGFILLPFGWTSFNTSTNSANDRFDTIRDSVGDYGYIAFALFLFLQFAYKIGVRALARVILGEVFPFKLRSYMCGLVMAIRYALATISTKLYYDVEMLFTLPGAMCFYGSISVIGLITMYLILPETEQRSLENIELHYSDNRKSIFDIEIPRSKSGSSNESNN